MNLTLIISDNCKACERAKNVLQKIQIYYPEISVEIIDSASFKNSRISITPALLINQELFSYGDIDKNKLLVKLNRGSNAVH